MAARYGIDGVGPRGQPADEVTPGQRNAGLDMPVGIAQARDDQTHDPQVSPGTRRVDSVTERRVGGPPEIGRTAGRGPVAERAKIQAARIAWAMHRRLTGGDAQELDALVAR